MRNKKIADPILNAQAMDNALPDGKYLTSPKWGYSEREVVIEDGILSLVDDGKYKFHQVNFFEVNDVIKTLPL